MLTPVVLVMFLPIMFCKTMGLRKLGQSVNVAGVSLLVQIVGGGKQSLAIPHVTIPDIRWVDWRALKDAGFQGCVFDKDNTLTVPYGPAPHEDVEAALKECMEVFEGRVALYSNSAGLQQYDPEGEEARAMEQRMGIPVLRHKEKKPAGGPEDLERHFGCAAEDLVMVGDRYLTDVVYGNRLGMLTVRPTPFTLEGETATVKMSRRIEERLVGGWEGAGRRAPEHKRVPEGKLAQAAFVKHPGVW